VTQHLPTSYVFDAADPRAPSHEQWNAMAPAERARVVAMLPARVPLELMPPEGDSHRKAKEGALRALDDFWLIPQIGRFTSEVLGLDLRVENARLRFFAGNAQLEDADETITRLGALLDEVLTHKVDAEKLREEAERLREESEHRAAALAAELTEEKKLREEAERRLAEALLEIDRLQKPRA
jgi:hypothetical protein